MLSILVNTIGKLRLTIYENPDFTGMVDSFEVVSLNLTFDSNLHPFFGIRAK